MVAVAVLVATVLAVIVGVASARSSERRSGAFVMSVAGAVLGGLLLLQAVLVVVFSLAGWAEWR